MVDALDALVAAFLEHRHRIAVFDRRARVATGQWELVESIPIAAIIDQFSTNETLKRGDRIVLPIHETDSAELTGEYLLARRTETGAVLSYFDFSAGSVVDMPIETVDRRYPAWRLRFWHPQFLPPETPSFIRESLLSPSPAPASTTTSASDDSSETPIPADKFFEELLMFVEREREAHRTEIRERYERTAGASFFDAGEGIRRLRVADRRVDEEGNQLCILTARKAAAGSTGGAPDPSSLGLYEGTEVLLDTQGVDAGFPVEGVIKELDGDEIAVWVRWTSSGDHAAAESAIAPGSSASFRLVKLLDPIPFDRQRTAVADIRDDDRKRALLVGDRGLTFDRESRIDPKTRHRLNQFQLTALRRSLETDAAFCIHGPPGTGKTRTLVHIIREAVYDGDKVLACAHSNQAVDNLLVGSSTLDRVDKGSLHAFAQSGEFDMARAGNNSQNDVVNDMYRDKEFWGVNVVGATTSAAHRFRPDEFDLVVVDEATQATIPSTLIPYSKGERLILAGDHNQLPPYVSSELDSEERIEISLFEHLLQLHGDSVSTMLRRQYRMNETIAAFPNAAFYGGRLTHGQRNRNWTIRDLDPVVALHVDGIEERTPAGSYYNEDEIDEVCAEVDRLLKRGVLPGQIGVISPYSGQVGKICASLDSDVLDRGLQVSTVDAFQGSERDAIVVSFVRSNRRGNTGFLTFPTEGARRLNVALTRARKRLVLIGNWDTLTTTPPNATAEGSCVELYRDLHDHLATNGYLEADSRHSVG